MENTENNLYSLDGRISLGKAIPLGLQHILAMFVANITPILILVGVYLGQQNDGTLAEGLKQIPADSAVFLIQNAMIIAGIGTLVQLYPVWKVGSRLPIVMGISFTFLSVAISISVTKGMGALMGAVLIGGLAEGLLGLFAKYWVKLISPVVAATVVIGIGFSLLGVGANSFAGGQGAPDFGASYNWIIGSVTLLVCLLFNIFGKGFIKRIAVLMGLVAGYILAVCMGHVDFSALKTTSIVALPHLMPFGFEFDAGAILSVFVIYLVSATETLGDTSAVCATGLDRDVTEKEISGSVACDGFVSALGSVFGCTPITSFSQNVGLVQMTKVVNRFVIATGAIIMIIAGIFPIFGAALTTVPQAVLGGCTIMMFGMIVVSGFQMFSKCGFTERNITICALSLSVGLGFTSAADMFNIFPEIIKSVFAQNCVAVVFLLAVILNLVLPKEKETC